MGISIQANIPLNGEDEGMTTERRYSEHDMKIAERIASLETTVHDTVVPLLRDILANCKSRCDAPPRASDSSIEPSMRSTAWFWGKVAGAVSIVIGAVTTLGVAFLQKAPEIFAAVAAFFNPPKHP